MMKNFRLQRSDFVERHVQNLELSKVPGEDVKNAEFIPREVEGSQTGEALETEAWQSDQAVPTHVKRLKLGLSQEGAWSDDGNHIVAEVELDEAWAEAEVLRVNLLHVSLPDHQPLQSGHDAFGRRRLLQPDDGVLGEVHRCDLTKSLEGNRDVLQPVPAYVHMQQIGQRDEGGRGEVRQPVALQVEVLQCCDVVEDPVGENGYEIV